MDKSNARDEALKIKATARAARDYAFAEKLKIEAEKLKLEGAANAEKARLEGEKARLEGGKARLEGVANAEKTRADITVKLAEDARVATKVKFQRYRGIAYVGCLLGAGLALSADYFYNEYEPIVKWRVRQQLLKHVAFPPPAHPKLVLESPTEVVKPGGLVMLLGPTGSGKTTLLKQIYNTSTQPVMLISIRDSPDGSNAPGKYPDGSTSNMADSAQTKMNRVAKQVFERMDYPLRLSYLGWFFRNASLPFMAAPKAPVQPAISSRLIEALRLLFSVSDEIYHDLLAKGKSDHDAKCLLIFDEVQDLIKDERLKMAGGQAVFSELATQLVRFGVDSQSVDAIVAGSSAQLNIEFNNTIASGNRWRALYCMADPTAETVQKALVSRGYSPDESSRIIDAVGTRLRLLDEPLRMSGPRDADTFISEKLSAARKDLKYVLQGLGDADAKVAKAMLDSLAAGTPVSYNKIPEAVRKHPLFPKVFYVDLDANVLFQNRTYEVVWRDRAQRKEIMDWL